MAPAIRSMNLYLSLPFSLQRKLYRVLITEMYYLAVFHNSMPYKARSAEPEQIYTQRPLLHRVTRGKTAIPMQKQTWKHLPNVFINSLINV